MTHNNSLVPIVMAVLLLFHLTLIGAWDIYCYYYRTPEETVTAVIQEWGRGFLLLVLLIGIVLGHLFFPTGPPPKTSPNSQATRIDPVDGLVERGGPDPNTGKQ